MRLFLPSLCSGDCASHLCRARVPDLDPFAIRRSQTTGGGTTASSGGLAFCCLKQDGQDVQDEQDGRKMERLFSLLLITRQFSEKL